MSTYFVSDIHGEYDLFMRLLDEIKFSSDDEMIICCLLYTSPSPRDA